MSISLKTKHVKSSSLNYKWINKLLTQIFCLVCRGYSAWSLVMRDHTIGTKNQWTMCLRVELELTNFVKIKLMLFIQQALDWKQINVNKFKLKNIYSIYQEMLHTVYIEKFCFAIFTMKQTINNKLIKVHLFSNSGRNIDSFWKTVEIVIHEFLIRLSIMLVVHLYKLQLLNKFIASLRLTCCIQDINF